MIQLLANFVFVLQLLEKSNVTIGRADDVLESIKLPARGVADSVDHAARAFADEVDDFIAEDFTRQCLTARRRLIQDSHRDPRNDPYSPNFPATRMEGTTRAF